MYKKSVLAVCIAAAVTCALALNSRQTLSKGSIQNNSSSMSKSEGLPPHVPYLFLFQHLSNLRKQTANQERLGKDGSGFQRRFKNVLVVDDDQFEKIEEVALQTESAVEELDKKAKAIAEAFRAQYPPGNVPKGVIIPPPPGELMALQEMRNSAILRGRDQLRAVLGEQEFARFDEILKARLTPSIKRLDDQ